MGLGYIAFDIAIAERIEECEAANEENESRLPSAGFKTFRDASYQCKHTLNIDYHRKNWMIKKNSTLIYRTPICSTGSSYSIKSGLSTRRPTSGLSRTSRRTISSSSTNSSPP